MEKMPLNWKIKSKWFSVVQTVQQTWNWVKDETLTPKGHEAYDYYCKVIFDDYQPVSLAETMLEDDMQKFMKEIELEDRRSAAILSAGRLAKHIAPWDFKKKEHKVVSD